MASGSVALWAGLGMTMAAFAVAVGFYRVVVPKELIAPVDHAKKWMAIAVGLSCLSSLPKFFIRAGIDAFVGWVVGAIFFGVVGFFLGWAYGKLRASGKSAANPDVIQPPSNFELHESHRSPKVGTIDDKLVLPKQADDSEAEPLLLSVLAKDLERLVTTGSPDGAPTQSEDTWYEQALEELEKRQPIRSTWARALAESDGEHSRANAAYIRLRVKQLEGAKADRKHNE